MIQRFIIHRLIFFVSAFQTSAALHSSTSKLLPLIVALPVALSSIAQAADPAPASTPQAQSASIGAFQTRFARILLDAKGFITSIKDINSGKEYCPAGRPSPLLSLHEHDQPNDKLIYPSAAAVRPGNKEIELKYPNGSVAVIKAESKDGYIRFQLLSLEQRGKVSTVVWGPLDTNISGKIGDIIGVVRSDDFAIGMLGVDDNTIPGPVIEADGYNMGYFVHSPDPAKYPIPAPYKEGDKFSVGGDGTDDHAFYAHPEECFQQVFGSGAWLQPAFGSSVAYHARDRRQSFTYFYSIFLGFDRYRPRHVVSDPLPNVDFIGSTLALYACPDDLGLTVLEKIHKDEGMPFITDSDGKWIRNPAAVRPTLWWNGPVDKAIEYAQAMGFRNISRDTGEFYASRTNKWVGHVPLSDGKSLTYKEFGDQCKAAGLTHGGLHTLTLFLQGGVSNDVTPVPNSHLQTVCRTKLAKDISATDTEIVVTEPSFLAEKGTWHWGDESNYLLVGDEMMRYDGISDGPPWTLKGIKRGHASKATEHKAGDTVGKLMQNCFNGYVPDMTLMLDYADYYADLMARNGMDDIGWDGYESMLYQHHGYYAFKVFNRRLFDTYHKLTGHWPHITLASNVFAGAWEYNAATNVGGGGALMDIPARRWGTQGKDIRNGYAHSYYPPTMGGQGWNSNWSLYEAENLMSMAAGWDATFGLSVTQAALDATADRDAIFKAYKAWMDARGQQAFTKAQKERLKENGGCFHLEQTGPKSFVLYSMTNTRKGYDAAENPTDHPVTNGAEQQPFNFDFQTDGEINGVVLTLPDGNQINCDRKLEKLQFVICKGDHAYLADVSKKKIADLELKRPAVLPKGDSKLGVRILTDKPGKVRFAVTTYIRGAGEKVGE